jgi:hypothetical protein
MVDLQERRRQLPYTWHWSAHEPNVADKTWRPLFALSSEREMVAHLDWCEEEYGIGHYTARRELLDAALAFLEREGHADLATVVDVLTSAKQAKDAASTVGTGIDDARAFVEDREAVRRDARAALRRLSAFQHERTAPELHGQLDRPLQSILDYLETSPLFVEPVKTPTRRPRPGHQPEPWIADAKRKLVRAKVPKTIIGDLLIAVGLLPYRRP